jgi:nucleotide-binding universal stress UspA family protein
VSPAASFPVLVASDGSPEARAAVTAAVAFPWPSGARATGVIGRDVLPVALPRRQGLALEASLEAVAEETRRALAERWKGATVSIVGGRAAKAILEEARRRRARAIVVGAQGHSALSRLVLGSVSRQVVRGARCAVLVARGAPTGVRNVVVGVDGSTQARRAVDLLARLTPARGARATVVRVLEPVHIPSLALLPARARAVLSAEAAALHARHLRAAEREVKEVARRLGRRWRTGTLVRIGTPAQQLLRAAREAAADVVVVGARGSGGLEGLLLGSVADTVLEQFGGSVLVAR